jgi:transcriptional regulator with XRE-family HTH domain
VAEAPQRTVGDWVHELRLRRGWSLQSLANRAHISKAYLLKLEKGESNPTEDVIKRLAAALDVRAAVLLGEVVDPNSPNAVLPPSLREFIDAEKPEPDLVAAMCALDFRGHPPETAREWRQIYRVMKALTEVTSDE